MTAPVRMLAIAGILLGCIAAAPAGAVPPPSSVRAEDAPGDMGEALTVTWAWEGPDGEVTGFRVMTLRVVADSAGDMRATEWILAGETSPDTRAMTIGKLERGTAYQVKVVALGAGGQAAEAGAAAPATPHMNWFIARKATLAWWIFGVSVAIVGSVLMAWKGVPMRVRRIAALEAVDDAVGRATEMGRPVLFIAGIQDMDNVQTVAGITVLSRVSKTAAEYDATVEVPTSRSLVMEAAREAVQASYLSAGRSDSYNPDLIRYITDEQFGFVAYVSGRMVRERPAACFYMGCFFAESLIFAETGNSIGAIQIAGTAESAQLPFFVAACDYTLIGEEFFAASAYLSGEPLQIGSLRGQDVCKAAAGGFIIAGVAAKTLAALGVGGAAAAAAWIMAGLGA
ncbi:MAG: hypothetical protein FGM37_06755 [Phycisphaerales bacterium]|nr:hypothetical protein [Phycisphaerales bacterium]